MKMFNPPHPGNVLKELYLKPLGLTVTKTAEGLDVTRKTLSSFLNGKSGVSTEMSLRLSEAFDTTPEHWLNLQHEYDLWNAEDRMDLSKIAHFYEDNAPNHC